MRPSAVLLSLPLVLALGLPASAAPAASSYPGSASAASAYVVVLRDGADPHQVAGAAAAAPGHVYRSVLNGFSARLSPGQVDRVRRDPAVLAV